MSATLRLRSQLNQLGFSLRSSITWGRRYKESGAKVAELSPYYRELLIRYGFDSLAEKLNSHSLLLNLSKLDQLEKLFTQQSVKLSSVPLQVLDIGSQHFVYAPALSLFVSRWQTERARQVELTGIEVDAYRRYRSFHTRRDLARYYASLRPWTSYQVGDLLQLSFPKRFQIITFFRPHVVEEPLVKAGLPLSLHRPEENFRRALDLLEPGGKLILSYQSEAEAEEAQRLLRKLGANPTSLIRWDPPEGSVEKRPQWFQLA